MKIKVVITGATGMVGEGVLHECLKHPEVANVIVINRRPCGVQHHKLEEVIHTDFFDFSSVQERLRGYNACFFCMGVSSVGMDEEKYHKLTYDITTGLADAISEVNPDAAFCYISGTGTDSTEQGRSMWARVKGKTENYVLGLFKKGYAFRPGYIQPIKGLKNTYKVYKFIAPLYPVLKTLFPGYTCTLEDIGLAMIQVAKEPRESRVLECRDITRIAHEQ